MPKFSLKLALIDYLPNIFFGVSTILLGFAMPNFFFKIIFLIGAFVSLLAGLMKATWKLLIAVKSKDVKWLNHHFFPRLMSGFLLMLAGFILALATKQISLGAIFSAIASGTSLFFLVIFIVFVIAVSVYKKTKFKPEEENSNMLAEILNCLMQLSFLLLVITALK